MKTKEQIEKRLSRIDKLISRCEKHYKKYWELLQITDHTLIGAIFKGYKTYHYMQRRKDLAIKYNILINYKKQLEWVLQDSPTSDKGDDK